MIYLKEPNKFHSEVVAFNILSKELRNDLEKIIDKEAIYKKVFLNSLTDLVKPYGWDFSGKASLHDLVKLNKNKI